MSGYWRRVGRAMAAFLAALLAALYVGPANAQEAAPQPSDLDDVTGELTLFRDGELDAEALHELSSAVATADEPASAALTSQARILLELAGGYDYLTDQVSASTAATIAAEAEVLQRHIEAATTTISEPNLAANLNELSLGVQRLTQLDEVSVASSSTAGPDTQPSGPAIWLIAGAAVLLGLGLLRGLMVRRAHAHS